MGIFSKLSNVKPMGRSKFFAPGLYLVKLIATKLIKDGHKGDSIVIEAEVYAVSSDEEEAPGVGSTGAQVYNITGEKKETGLSNLMQFLTAVFGCDVTDKTDEEWEAIADACFDDNMLAGMYLTLETWNKQNKKNEGTYTVHNWKGLATEQDFSDFGVEVPADFES